MNKMIKRILAAILVTSMLLGSNGISYATETAAGDGIAGTEEVSQESEAGEQMESPGDSEESGPAYEESAATDTEEQAQEEAGDEGQEADAQSVEETGAEASGENDAAIAEDGSSEEEAADAEASEDTDAAAAELTAEEAAAAAAQAQEEVFTAGELVYHGGDYDVTLAYDEAAKIPATAELKVREIAKGSSEYESYLAGAEAAAGKGVAEARFFDITIWAAGTDGQQQEIQPQSPVRVSITYHSAIEVADEGEVQAMHFENGTSDAEVVSSDTNGGSEVSEIAFDAESFSVYGIIYTVDFTYGGYTFSMPGEGSIYLSELAEILGLYETDLDKAFSVSNVSDVSFTDYDLVKIEKQADGDWLLISLAPFTSEETLTIEMNDGVTFIVDVTDAQTPTSASLEDFLKNAVIDAPQNDDGAYIVQAGDTYKVTLYFREGSSLQFANDQELTYQLPEGITGDQQEGDIVIKVTSYDGTVTRVGGNHYRLDENGILHFTWSDDDDIATVFSANNVNFSISIEGTFDNENTHIVFSDEVEKYVIVDTSSSVATTKSAQVDVSNDRVHYTTTVTSTGTSRNVVLEDTITGNGISLDPTSIVAVSNTGETVDMTGGAAGNSFMYTIPTMRNGERITFTYDAIIDPFVLEMVEGKVVTQAGNTFSAVSDGNPEGDRSPVTNTIDYTPTIKKSNGKSVGKEGTVETLSWTITVNEAAKVSAYGIKVTDTIGVSSRSIMKYSGNGITIAVTDAEGNPVRDDVVTWEELESKTDTSWTYSIPQEDKGKAYKYVITYTTEVETKDLTQFTNVDNTGTTTGGGSSTGGGQVGPSTEQPTIDKTLEEVDLENKEVTWKVSFTVPADGLNKAVVTDTYPTSGNVWIDDTNYTWYDIVKQGSVEIDGLVDGETRDIVYGDKDVTITFKYNDSPGLKGTGSTRTITVTLKTALDPDWLSTTKDPAFAYKRNHINNVDLDYGAAHITDSATAIITAPDVDKTVKEVGTRTVNGVELPIYEYHISLFGVGKDVNEITDTFDTELLEVYRGIGNAFWVYYGNNMENPNWPDINNPTDKSWSTGVPATYVPSDTGMTIYTSGDSLKKRNDGTYYPVYGIVYYLTVKSPEALKTIMERASEAEDQTYSVDNAADWNGETDTSSVVFSFKGLDKELLTENLTNVVINEDGTEEYLDDIIAEYRITLNPLAQTLNEMNPLTMTDTFENLSVVYDSIKVYRNSESEANLLSPDEYTVDFSGNTSTFTIPDATKIIVRYKARVIYGSDGGSDVHIYNKASMLSYEDEEEADASYTSSGEGSGSTIGIKLMKYETGNMNKRLKGAVFKLFNAEKTAEGFVKGSLVTDRDFVTGENGIITVSGDEEIDGWSLYTNPDDDGNEHWYILEEVEAPEGYMLLGYEHIFSISKDGSTNYTDYIYHNGDTMSAKNTPGTDVKVEKVWSDGIEEHANDSVTVKLQQKIGDGDWSDSIRKEVKEGTEYVWQDVTDGMTIELNAGKGWSGYFYSLPLRVPTDLTEPEPEYDDVDYRVVETEVNGKTPAEGTVNIVKTEGKYIFTITNTVEEETGDLTVSKEVVSDAAADAGAEFTFTVTLSDTTISGEYGDMTFSAGVATVTLKGGESATATGLPTGVTYAVTEAAAAGFEQTGKTGDSGAISTTASEAVFTNTRETGDLTVSKVLVSDAAADADTEFTFTVTLGDTTISGEYGDMTFEAGVATVTLKGGESATATGLPTGITYTVTETEAEGFVPSVTAGQAEGEITTTASNVEYTNTKVKGGLVVQKEVQSASGNDLTKQFTFTVTLDDTTINGEYGDMTFENGVATFTLQHGGVAQAEGLPTGVGYTVAETTADGFETTYEGETSDTIEEGEPKIVKAVNTRESGSLTVSKVLVSDAAADADAEFTFTVTLSDTTISKTYGDMTFENGVATVTLKGGESATATGLPTGVTYAVTEAAAAGFSQTGKTGDTGTISTTASEAVFTNTRETGDLTVSKVLVSDAAADADAEFTFTVTLGDTTIGGEEGKAYGDMTFTNGVATVTLKGGESATATGLPTGVTYTVTEAAAEGFVATVTKGQAVGEITKTASEVEYTNTKIKGGLVVQKEVKSASGNDLTRQFEFTVTLNDTTISGEYGDMSFTDGVATFNLQSGGVARAENLPTGIGYTVVETSADGFTTTYEGETTGTIEEGEPKIVKAVNTRETGDLTVSKTVVSDAAADANVGFTFTVTLDDDTINGTFGEGETAMVFTDGVATVTLKGGESATATGLPTGITYTVTEAEAEGFELTAKTGDTGTISETKATAAFTNTRETGDLEVTKTVINKNSKNIDKDFSFTVTLSDKAISKTFGDMTFNKGVATFTLKDGETAKAEGLPTGITYTVTEADAEGFELSEKTGDTGTISTTASEAEFVNKYLASGDIELKLKKVLEGRPLENAQFEFELFGPGGSLGKKTCDSTGAVVFDKISYDQDDMEKDESGYLKETKITYTVKEVVPDPAADGYTYDTEERTITVTLRDNEDGTIDTEQEPELEDLVFTNTYEAKGDITLTARKVVPERALEEGKFNFVLTYPDVTTTQVKSNGADGTVTFDKIEYTQADIYKVDPETGVYSGTGTKEYTYTINEEIPVDAVNADGTKYEEASEAEKKAGGFKKGGYTYDGTVHTITVELKDNGDGTIEAKVAGSQGEAGDTGVVFTNAYGAAGTLKLDAEKQFKNGTLKGGEFTFKLMDAAGEELQSKTNDAAGNVSFDMITYKLADVANSPFTYTVKEMPGTRTDVKYDNATVYTVKVELEDKGDGTLEVTKEINNGGELKFVNEQLNVETSVTIGGEKVLKGRKLKEGEFKFVLADENGKWVDTATNDANGNFTFKPITYKLFDLKGEKSKVYTYGISEVKGSESGIIYDKKVYTVKVTVTDNGDGTMTAKADMARGDIRFVNTTSDKTGDEAPLGVLFGGLGFGVAGLAVLLLEDRKKKKNKE